MWRGAGAGLQLVGYPAGTATGLRCERQDGEFIDRSTFESCGDGDDEAIVALWATSFFSNEAGVGKFELRFADRAGDIECGHGGAPENGFRVW